MKRQREKTRVWDGVGLTALGEESGRLVDEISAVEHELVRLADSSPDIRAAAAHCIISLTYSFTGGDGFAVFEEGAAALSALRAIRPMLSGDLAEDADEALGASRRLIWI